MPLDLNSLEKAVTALNNVLTISEDNTYMNSQGEIARIAIISGVIKNFEFTYELCWKFIKCWLQMNVNISSAEGVTRRELFRQAAAQLLIDDIDQWMYYHTARNNTSHTYEPAIAQEVYLAIPDFAKDAEKLLAALKARND